MSPAMVIDCHSCPMRGTACEDCVVQALWSTPQVPREPVPLDPQEWSAVGHLVQAGLVSAPVARELTAVREPLGLRRAAG